MMTLKMVKLYNKHKKKMDQMLMELKEEPCY